MANPDLHRLVADWRANAWHPKAAEFYRAKGLSHSTVHRFGLGYCPPGTRYGGLYVGGRLAIPYEDGLYGTRQVRFRALDGREPKVLATGPSHIFAVRASDEAIGVICEGETDTMTAWECGVKAVGIPGANNWKPEWSYLFRNCDEVVIAFDMDENQAGQIGAHKVWRSLARIGVDVRRALFPIGKDLNDIYRDEGREAVKEVLGV